MKMYNNGQRPTKMYGGGMPSPRKPMQMGGLAQQNRKQQNPMNNHKQQRNIIKSKTQKQHTQNRIYNTPIHIF